MFGDAKTTNDHEQRYTLSLSGPISDTLTYRVSGAVRSYGGNVDNLTTGHKLNDDHTSSVRGKLRWQPDDKLSSLLTLGRPFSLRGSTKPTPSIVSRERQNF